MSSDISCVSLKISSVLGAYVGIRNGSWFVGVSGYEISAVRPGMSVSRFFTRLGAEDEDIPDQSPVGIFFAGPLGSVLAALECFRLIHSRVASSDSALDMRVVEPRSVAVDDVSVLAFSLVTPGRGPCDPDVVAARLVRICRECVSRPLEQWAGVGRNLCDVPGSDDTQADNPDGYVSVQWAGIASQISGMLSGDAEKPVSDSVRKSAEADPKDDILSPIVPSGQGLHMIDLGVSGDIKTENGYVHFDMFGTVHSPVRIIDAKNDPLVKYINDLGESILGIGDVEAAREQIKNSKNNK